ncbi:MAG: hypothetical protein JWO12_2012 [Frankiales bacterium]|nr:hypothetical protein [Frankiales bacterium]
MVQQASKPPVVFDPCVVLGRLAAALAEGRSLAEGLGVLVAGLGLRTAVLRTASGELLGVGGEVVHAVPLSRSVAGTSMDLPVGTATLSVVGARPSQLPALRAATEILKLGLTAAAEELLDGAEQDRDEIADALHDGPVQTLVVARYAADAAVRGGDALLARDAVQDALVDVRKSLWHLRPRGSQGLVESLRQLQAQVPFELDAADADLVGARAVLAYRLVQAVVRSGAGPVSVSRRGDLAVVEVPGDLAAPERWARRALALGGDLTSSSGLLRLVLPLSEARTPL